jgi:deazaflavin-dependent oxidoreductase (nitroreductase family)
MLMVLTLHDITSNLREGVDPVPRSAMNLVPSIIIQSPFHALMSSKYAMIEFSGRKTGRTYKTPIAYVRDGNQLLMSTDSPWHRNLAGGAQVRMRLRGHMVKGTADTVGPDRSAEILRQLVDAIPSYARPAGLTRKDGHVSDSEITRAVAEGRVGIEVKLEAAP